MSARVCFLRRSARGAALHSLRLIGETSDEAFPQSGSLRPEPADYALAARWVRERLDATRSTSSVAMLCLDVEGSVCAWAQTTSADPAVVAAGIRFGSAEGARPGGGAFDFYAPSEAESVLQPLAPLAGPGRAAVLGVADVPGRLMVDALDREGVPVESASTLWHAMSDAWDPAAHPAAHPAPQSDHSADAATDAGPVTAIILTDAGGRLVWCWSRAGRLLVAGSMLLRKARSSGVPEFRSEESQPRAEGEQPPAADQHDVSRLAAEWLSWSLQMASSPRRVLCILREADDAAAFGEALGRAWPGATIDVVRHEDPVGATLTRFAANLEATPRARVGASDAARGLATLGQRPARAHRRMYLWSAAALFALAGAVAIGAWQLSRAAAEARASASTWNDRWRDVIKNAYPEGLRPVPGVSPVTLLTEEITRREREMLPVERTDQTMPVLAELETISLVLTSAGCELEEIGLDSALRPYAVALVGSSQEAEEILSGLGRIGGSVVTNWTLSVTERLTGTERKVRAEYRGEWVREPAQVAGGGST